MTRPLFAALALALAAAGPARAQSVSLMVVQSAAPDRMELTILRVVATTVDVQKVVTVVVNGQPQKQVVTEKVLVPTFVPTTMKLSDATAAYTGDGKKLELADALKKLKKGSVVVMGPTTLATPQYAGVFAPDTVLLLSNAVPADPGAMPVVPGKTPVVPKGF